MAVINPPITTVAKGFCTSAPAPVDNAIGINPKAATEAVINTGRKRIFVPSNTLWKISFIPFFSSWLNVLINTIPFNTATPNKAIKPTPAEILNGIPLSNNANTPPIALMGMAVKINRASFIEPKAK